MRAADIPDITMKEYNLYKFVKDDRYVYFEIGCGMYGLQLTAGRTVSKRSPLQATKTPWLLMHSHARRMEAHFQTINIHPLG